MKRLAPLFSLLIIAAGCATPPSFDPEKGRLAIQNVGAPPFDAGADNCESEFETRVWPAVSHDVIRRLARVSDMQGGWARLSFDLDGSGKAINIALIDRSPEPAHAMAIIESLMRSTFRAGAVRVGCKRQLVMAGWKL